MHVALSAPVTLQLNMEMVLDDLLFGVCWWLGGCFVFKRGGICYCGVGKMVSEVGIVLLNVRFVRSLEILGLENCVC